MKSNFYRIIFEEKELGILGIETHEVYIQSSVGLQELDRIKVLGTNEFYRVEGIRRRRYEAVDVVKVGEDVRPSTTTTTTFSTTTTTTTA